MINTMQVIETAVIENPTIGFLELAQVIRNKTPIQTDPTEIERLMGKMVELLPVIRANTVEFWKQQEILGAKIRAERAAKAAETEAKP